ncbi:hypothetical protein F5B22DRAFT_630741 [Xylaria bambusicola]|uniref:uncharacterized protein n=1 Tax=Xylaria bambusicola TaxID=326684 RepID=UPI0020080309|nr:uncharacterized protein F5B22DRAFT_630741 [Xylaria bambusicola]KAI0503079.1 hypothetical protein F5B22DRAFT_630741 [Xylaria bambusicola]
MAAATRLDTDPAHMWKEDSIEERGFAAALICLEGHYQQSPAMGPQSIAKVMSIISKTLEKTHTYKDVREILSKNIRIWLWLRRSISAAICDLNEKSLGVRSEPFVATRFIDITTPEVTALIIKNYVPLKEALQMLNKLMHIARNLLVTTNPEIPQNLSATINFDHEVIEAICLCVNVLSKGIDGEMPEDDASRVKLNEITELYKKVLVTSLQQAHNWIAKNDRNKMTFWYRVFIESPDVDLNPEHDDRYDIVGSTLSPRCLYLQEEVRNWIKRNTVMCRPAAAICQEYLKAKDPEKPDLWFPHQNNLAFVYTNSDATDTTPSTWDPNAKEKFSQDWQYGRVSHELDMWWEQARLPNITNMDSAQSETAVLNDKIRQCEESLMSRYAPPESPDEMGDVVEHHTDDATVQEWPTHPPQDTPHYAPEYDEYEEEADDDDSYGEGPMTGLLTEVPNILDPKQIEALHMIIKSCILDSAGSGPTRHGESLQQARCRIMLATECGRNLLREMLVFIAVWEKDEQSLIFQISSQIVQALHESCLIHHTWEAVRSPKDIMSPAQTVLLRLITYLARTAFLPSKNYNPDPDPKGDTESRLANPDFRLSRMLHYFYTVFRNRIAPECIALMRIQGEVRAETIDPADFPVDNWDLERAKDGLVQFLDFLYTIADIYPLRQHLIEYDAVHDLIKLLEGLDVAVERAPLPVNRRNDAAATASASIPTPQPSSSSNPPPPPPPPPPPLSEPPHEFPWAGIKGQVLSILAALLQPPPGQNSPGNPTVQLQIVKHNGIVALLNCCLYDDNNRFCRERTQLCLKWLMDGSPDAAAFLQNLISTNQNRPATGGQPVRIDGVPGEVKIQVRSASAPAAAPENTTTTTTNNNNNNTLGKVETFNFEANLAASRSQAAALARRLEENKSRSEELVNDLLALTVSGDPRARRAADPVDADETEDEDFM